MDSPDSKSVKSVASISVTIPSTRLDEQRQSGSPKTPSRSPLLTNRISPDLPYAHHTQYLVDAGARVSYSHPSSGTIPPQGTPTHGRPNDRQIRRATAVAVIERAWMSYRDIQMFKLLKHAICAAEHSMSYEILRKVSPREAELVKDKTLQVRVRFRFGGSEYPPMIFFKVYTCVSGTVQVGVRYMSGKKLIQPASEAARDACDLMGHRKFYDQMITDAMQQESGKVTSEIDIITLKDYMQYLSTLDETPAYMGGKDNSWRQLTLEVLPRQTIFYDVVEYLYSHKLSPALQQELPFLLSRPLTQDIQLKHIQIISQLRTPDVPYPSPAKSKLSTASTHHSGRRSKQARTRAMRMKKLYEEQAKSVAEADGVPTVKEEDWEAEADKLYEWTQELSFDEILATPRLPTATY